MAILAFICFYLFVRFLLPVFFPFISLYFFTKDHELIRSYIYNSRFKAEFVFIRQIARNVVAAYFKTQLIIFGIISILCTIGFIILKNPYSILYGIIIGILDIIPLIVFVLCYLTREILEPKLIGGSMGIHPLISLLAIFAGYKLFGVFGMIIGPFGYVFITEILKAYDNLEKAPR